MTIRILLILLLASFAYADVKVQDGRISADLQSQPLSRVLDHLRSHTSIRMVVDEGIGNKTVSARFQDLPIGLALKKLLEGTGINYVVLADADGEPESVFIGSSSRPGAPPRRLDNRPVGNRGVVSPVPPPPPPPPPAPGPEMKQPEAQPKPQMPGTNIPTGGGFTPAQPVVEQPGEDEPRPQEELDDNNSED